MFGRSKTPRAGSGLTDRVQQIAQRPAQAPKPEFIAQEKARAKPRAERRALFRNGGLLIDDGQRVAVAIKNLSDSGARIEYFTKMDLPDYVTLVEPTLKLRRRAQVIWQTDGAAGLMFVEA